uniref:ATPTG10-like domain-containing protein n=1 Tax=Theileria annulata TaxID=5874 RepID=A0A3B0MGC6_THEAN
MSPGYLANLLNDLEKINKFINSVADGDKKGMLESFNGFSWDDERVRDHLPKYCELNTEDLKYIDKVFSHLCPKFNQVNSPSLNTMALWLKTRLHLQHQLSPFQLT